MNRLFHRLAPMGLPLLAASALQAELPRLGLSAGAAWPTGATRSYYTDSAGYALGAFADWEQRPGHTLRLALDGCFHPRATNRFPLEDAVDTGRAQSQALTLNYVLKPSPAFQGLTFLVGAGAMNVQRIQDGWLLETGVKLAWTAGIGVDLDEHWGLQTRYHSLRSRGRDVGTLTAGLTYRF